MEEKRKSGYRSLFWPIILIGVGVFLLLAFLVLADYPDWGRCILIIGKS